MIKFDFNSTIASLLGIGAFVVSSHLTAQTQAQSPKTPVNAKMDDCSRDLLLAYFPKAFVDETLKKFNVPKDHWEAINKDLSTKDKEIIKEVEEKASKINPNPLKDPQQRQVAVKLFKETLLEKFTAVMTAYGIRDEKQISSMLDDIQKQKAERFAQCMQKQKAAQNNDEDQDDEDEDDEDEDEDHEHQNSKKS